MPLGTGPAPARPARRSSGAPAAARGADPLPCRRRPGSAWPSRHAVVLQAADGRRREPSDGLGIVAEAADPERRIGRIVGHVAHRRVVHVDAEGTQLARRRAGDALGQRLRRRSRRAPSRPRTASSRRPGRPAGRPPGRRRPATAALRPAVPPGWRRSARGSGAGRRRCGARNSVTPATPCSLIRLAADGGSSVPAKAIMSRARVTT